MSTRAISGSEAWNLIVECIEHTPCELTPLASSLNAVSAETLVAPVSIPPWRAASMDGFAVRSQDLQSTPCTLRVTGTAVAGGPRASAVGVGEAAAIMTGAPVPDGADTVIRVEDTYVSSGSVEIRDVRDAGRNVRPLGEDFHQGDVLLAAGDRIGAAAIGVLASAGFATVPIYRRPTASIIASGDELVGVQDFAQVTRGDRIVSSNSYSLAALVRDAGGVPRDGGIVRDSPSELRDAIDEAMACDLLITSGGVSVGDRDYVNPCLLASYRVHP